MEGWGAWKWTGRSCGVPSTWSTELFRARHAAASKSFILHFPRCAEACVLLVVPAPPTVPFATVAFSPSRPAT